MVYGAERRLVVLLSAVIVLTAGIGYFGSGRANAKPKFTPRPGPVFNNPGGTTAQQYAIMRQIERNIDASPRGSVIRIAIYSITLDRFAAKLIAAHRRGVHVKVLMDEHAVNGLWKRLRSALGGTATTKSKGSFAALCPAGCMAPHYHRENPSSLHSKYYLFSGGGKSKRTVTVSSANPTRRQAEAAWNNSYTVVGNPGLYNAYVKNFNDMVRASKGAHKKNYYWTHGKNPKAYFWPKARSGSDTILNMLKLVSCSRRHPSRVRVAMFQWTDGRIALARRLARMADKGCQVTVLYTRSAISSSVRKTLADSKVTVRDSTYKTRADGYAKHYTHNKYVLIDGRYNGVSNRKIVLTGSANFTINGLYHNDEANLRIISSSAYRAYLKNFQDQLAAVPAAAARARAEGRLPEIPLHPDDLRDS